MIQRQRGEEIVLTQADFLWEQGRRYALKLCVQGKSAVLCIDDTEVLRTDTVDSDYGMAALAKLCLGRTMWEKIEITEYKNR